ncbi:hypothetical protein BGX26_004516 [Mortierella sp. AD094]|nr:hypothetical protein BGX26_004516 [Mortierella sp. AD094]
MHTKFDSIYFAVEKNQTLGPQDRSHAYADEKSNKFYVTYIGGVSSDGKTSYYEFASYKDLPAFLKAYSKIPDKGKCFNEQIREGYACSEHYDIDWTLKSPVEDLEETVQLEQRVFEEFLQQRNQYAPKYPVSEDQCRVLSSSSSSKVSLHIVIPTYTFDNNNQHMLKFMQDFKIARSKQDQDENSLGDHIDMGVYSKNRGIRCLGSCKRNDMSRRFIRAPWHQSSVHALDAEFFITNVRPDSTKVDRMPATNRQSSSTRCAIAPPPIHAPVTRQEQSDTANRVSLLQHVFDAVHNIFTEFEHDAVQNKSIKPEDIGQYKMQYSNYGMTFKLQRDHVGHCMMCKREHESDNGYLRLSETTGEIYLYCYRSLDTTGIPIGRLPFDLFVEVMIALCSTTPFILDGAATYNSQFVKHEFLSPPLEPLKLGNSKFEITKKQLPSLMLRSATRTGKTKFIEMLVQANKGFKFICITCRKTLADMLEERLTLAEMLEGRLGFTNYKDIDGGLIACDKVVVQAESLYRLDLDFYGESVILILDEFSSVCEQMTSTTTMGDKHDLNNEMLPEFIQGVSRVICLDADLTNEEVQLVMTLRDDVHVIHNTFKPQDGGKVLLYESESLLMQDMHDLFGNKKRMWISSTLSANSTESLHRQLEDEGFRGMCVTSKTSEDDKRDIAQNINTIMADLDYFIHTPTISVGIDFNVEDQIGYVVGIFPTQSGVNVETYRQMLRRVRHVKSKTYLVYTDAATNNLPTTTEAVNSWISNQGNIVTGNIHTLQVSGLRLRAKYGGGLSLPDSFYSRLFIYVHIKRNLSKNGFRQRFVQQMLDVGCEIIGVQGHAAKGNSFLKSRKEKLTIIKREEHEQIANANCLTQEDFDRLYRASEITASDRSAVTKYLLMKAYDITAPEIVDSQWVQKYNNEKEKSVYKNLRALSMAGGVNLQAGLNALRQQEQISLSFCISNGRLCQIPHKLKDSRYVKLKYAVDILIPCGFTSLLPSNTVTVYVLHVGINAIWGNISEEMSNICTTLEKPMPVRHDWQFRNKLDFLEVCAGRTYYVNQ